MTFNILSHDKIIHDETVNLMAREISIVEQMKNASVEIMHHRRHRYHH